MCSHPPSSLTQRSVFSCTGPPCSLKYQACACHHGSHATYCSQQQTSQDHASRGICTSDVHQRIVIRKPFATSFGGTGFLQWVSATARQCRVKPFNMLSPYCTCLHLHLLQPLHHRCVRDAQQQPRSLFEQAHAPLALCPPSPRMIIPGLCIAHTLYAAVVRQPRGAFLPPTGGGYMLRPAAAQRLPGLCLLPGYALLCPTRCRPPPVATFCPCPDGTLLTRPSVLHALSIHGIHTTARQSLSITDARPTCDA